MARALGIELHRFSSLPGGRRGLSVVGQQRIDIAERNYDPADEFAIAHEVVELHLPKKMGARHEEFVDRVAAALLLPQLEFLSSVSWAVFDVAAVRRKWPWASFTAIIWRIADLCPGVAAARWYRGGLIERRSQHGSGEVTAAERAAVRSTGKGFVLNNGTLAMAWHLSGRGEQGYSVSLALRPMG